MKTEIVSKISRLSRALLAATLALAGAASVKGDGSSNFFNNNIAGVNLGNASGGTGAGQRHWAIFSLGGNVTITDPNPYSPSGLPGSPTSDYSAAGSADVYGNVGIVGSGKLSMTNSYIDGFVTEATVGQLSANTITGGTNPHYLGSIGLDQAYLTQGYNDAIAASAAALVAGSHGGTTILSTTTSTAVFTNTYAQFTTTGTPRIVNIPGGGYTEANLGITDTGLAMAGKTYVLNISDLILQGASAVLTLHGTATTNYIFNIDRYMTLAGGAKINIDGSSGLTAANVLYNVNQNSINGVQYDVTLSGGSQASGIILATTRAVKETGDSKIFGEVIAKSVSLSGASNVINPLVSP